MSLQLSPVLENSITGEFSRLAYVFKSEEHGLVGMVKRKFKDHAGQAEFLLDGAAVNSIDVSIPDIPFSSEGYNSPALLFSLFKLSTFSGHESYTHIFDKANQSVPNAPIVERLSLENTRVGIFEGGEFVHIGDVTNGVYALATCNMDGEDRSFKISVRVQVDSIHEVGERYKPLGGMTLYNEKRQPVGAIYALTNALSYYGETLLLAPMDSIMYKNNLQFLNTKDIERHYQPVFV